MEKIEALLGTWQTWIGKAESESLLGHPQTRALMVTTGIVCLKSNGS